MNTQERVIEVVAAQLGIDASKIDENSTFETLGADSLDTVELVMALEETFGQEIPDEEAEQLTSVGATVAWLEANLH